MGVGREPKPLQRLANAIAGRGGREPVDVHEREEQVVERGEVGKKIVGLEHGAHRPPVGEERHLVARQSLAVERHAAGHGDVEAGEDPQERRLAATRWPHEYERLDLAGDECEPVEHRRALEPLHEVVDVEPHVRPRSERGSRATGRGRRAAV